MEQTLSQDFLNQIVWLGLALPFNSKDNNQRRISEKHAGTAGDWTRCGLAYEASAVTIGLTAPLDPRPRLFSPSFLPQANSTKSGIPSFS